MLPGDILKLTPVLSSRRVGAWTFSPKTITLDRLASEPKQGMPISTTPYAIGTGIDFISGIVMANTIHVLWRES
jgi:hypothetical protein